MAGVVSVMVAARSGSQASYVAHKTTLFCPLTPACRGGGERLGQPSESTAGDVTDVTAAATDGPPWCDG